MPVEGEVEACIRAEYARLVGVVAMVTGSVHVAEDAVQEAFARAWERSDGGVEFRHLAGWVAVVALNEARRGHRRRGTEKRALDRVTAARVVPGAADLDTAVVLRGAVATLARRQRDAVVLYYLLDLDVATVAGLLSVSEGTVKSALSRARDRLAVLLAAEEMEA